METYQPPFTINNEMLNLAAKISEKTGLISGYHSFASKPHLRRNNRIRSVHASVAIEANSLSLDEVRGVIDGKTVIGPLKAVSMNFRKNTMMQFQHVIRQVIQMHSSYSCLTK